MSQFWEPISATIKSLNIKKIIKKACFFILGVFIVLLILMGALALYFKANKAKIVTQINTEINTNIIGKIYIGDINHKFLKGFPNMTLALSHVEVKDSLWAVHKRTLLQAEQIEVRIDIFNLLKNQISIDKIEIQNATLHLFKGKDGVVNTAIFKSRTKQNKSKNTTTSRIKQVVLSNVHFISENLMANKLFDFDAITLKSDINFENTNWHAKLDLKTVAKSMAFNTNRGSFIKDQTVEGTFKVDFSNNQNQISVITQDLLIGKDLFAVKGKFSLDKNKSPFEIAINTTILWRSASNLLSNNISRVINQFDLKKPIQVSCTIIGDMNAVGDPEIVVQTKTQDNQLKIPDGVFSNCSFSARFTNQNKKGGGCNDINSTVTLNDFSGKYKTIPFSIPVGVISNFEKTTASGVFKSDFDLTGLNKIVNPDFVHFFEGKAKVNLHFKFDILNLKIQKPLFTGNVEVKNAVLNYGPRNVTFAKTNIRLDFTQEALLIKKINFNDRTNAIFMEGKIDNFLTLYYHNPRKMLVNWHIYAPFLDLKQFLGILTNTKKREFKKKKSTDNFSDQLYSVIDKCQVVLHLKADKVIYNKLEATQAKATILLLDNQLILKNGSLNSSEGTAVVEGKLIPKETNFILESNVTLNKVAIAPFLSSVNNFGIESFGPKNIRGFLTASASVTGILLSDGQLKTNSLSGKATFNIDQGALLNFEPITAIGKFAFPFRDVNTIIFRDLSGIFKINGDFVDVKDLKISSNVLNLDVNGVYSFGRGTKLYLTIPIRNPAKDGFIIDEIKREEKRNKGIVLYLMAVDQDGKIKIRWNKNHN